MRSVAIINTSSPYSSANAQESLDIAMVAGTFGQDVALFFMDDGVFQLIENQQAQTAGRKNFHKSFAALEFYDVEKVYVCEQSLRQRFIQPDHLIIDVELVSQTKMQQTLSNYHHLLRF